jgi:hypothetical protein
MFFGPREIRAQRQQPAKIASVGKNCPRETDSDSAQAGDLARIRLAELLKSAESVWKIEEAQKISGELKKIASTGTDFANNIVSAVSIDPERAGELLKGK